MGKKAQQRSLIFFFPFFFFFAAQSRSSIVFSVPERKLEAWMVATVGRRVEWIRGRLAAMGGPPGGRGESSASSWKNDGGLRRVSTLLF